MARGKYSLAKGEVVTKEGIDKIVSFIYILDMETTMIHLKTKKDLKKRAEQLADRLGISLTGLVNLSLSQLVESSELVINLQPKVSAKNTQLLLRLKKQSDNRNNLSPTFTDPKKALKWLRS